MSGLKRRNSQGRGNEPVEEARKGERTLCVGRSAKGVGKTQLEKACFAKIKPGAKKRRKDDSDDRRREQEQKEKKISKGGNRAGVLTVEKTEIGG